MSRSTPSRRRVAVALVAAGGTALSGLALLGPATSTASSHREAPLISNDPAADNTDLYAFVSPDDSETVTLISNWAPLSEPTGGPTFYPFPEDTRYLIKIDNDGDAVEDITYEWTFETQDLRGDVEYPPADQNNDGTFLYNNGVVDSLDDANLLFRQTYDLNVIVGDAAPVPMVVDGDVAPSNTGAAGMPNYAVLRDAAIVETLTPGGKSYVGQADDPFFLDLRVFDLLYGEGTLAGNDTLDGYNVNTVALQVPKAELAINGDVENNPVIGVWTTTERRSTLTRTAGAEEYSGDFVQVSRLGNPLVNEVVIPAQLKDAFNAIPPSADATAADGAAVSRVLYPELPKLIEALLKVPAPMEPRTDLFEIFLEGIADESPINPQTGKSDGTDEIPANLNAHSLNQDAADPLQPSEQLRLNMSINEPTTEDGEASRLGLLGGDLQGFPNGRRLADDVIDIAIQVVQGAARTGLVEPLAAGDGVNANDVAFGSTFPYIALPSNAAVNSRNNSTGGGGGGTPPAGGGGGGGGTGGGGTGGGTAPTGGAATGFGGTALVSDSSVPVLPLGAALAGIVLAGSGVVMIRRRATS